VESTAVLDRPSKTGSPQPAQQQRSHYRLIGSTVTQLRAQCHARNTPGTSRFPTQKMCNYHMMYPQHELHHCSLHIRRAGAPRRLGGGEGHTTSNPTITTSKRDVISRVT